MTAQASGHARHRWSGVRKNLGEGDCAIPDLRPTSLPPVSILNKPSRRPTTSCRYTALAVGSAGWVSAAVSVDLHLLRCSFPHPAVSARALINVSRPSAGLPELTPAGPAIGYGDLQSIPVPDWRDRDRRRAVGAKPTPDIYQPGREGQFRIETITINHAAPGGLKQAAYDEALKGWQAVHQTSKSEVRCDQGRQRSCSRLANRLRAFHGQAPSGSRR